MSAQAWFGWHPVLMTLSFGLLMPLGRLPHLVEPALFGFKTTEARRTAHNILMGLAVVAMLLGYLAIFKAHLPTKHFFGYSFETKAWSSRSRVIHAWLGYAVILLALAQGTMGQWKQLCLRAGTRIFPFHGTLGKVVMVLGVVNTMIAISFWMWNRPMQATLFVATGATLLLSALLPKVEKTEGEEKPLMSGPVPAAEGSATA